MSELPIIEFENVMERLDGDKELFHELVALFSDTHLETLNSIKSAVTDKNSAEVRAHAHSIKGALGNVGAARAQAVAYELEKAGKNGEAARFGELCSTLERELADFFAEYKRRTW